MEKCKDGKKFTRMINEKGIRIAKLRWLEKN